MKEVAGLGDMLSQELLAELKRVELKARRGISSDLAGHYRTAFRGSGLIFSDIREYQPGDEIKNIHWKASARTGKVYVKAYQEERQLSVVIAVDISRSTDFGGARKKHRKALEFSALLAMLAMNNDDQVGLCLFSNQVHEFMRPKRGQSQVHRLMLELLKERELPRATDLNTALQYLRQNLKRRSVIFIVSDFYAKDFSLELRSLAKRHDLIGVMLEDQLDFDLPTGAIIEFADAENGRSYSFLSSSAKAKTLAAAQERRINGIKALFDGAGSDLIEINQSLLQPLATLMHKRKARLR